MMSVFGKEMKMHVLCIEYPGYGLYKTSQPDADQLLEDSKIVFDYLTTICGVNPSDIVLFGRSIGGGPATYLASEK
jgi:dienelactone hydrolase